MSHERDAVPDGENAPQGPPSGDGGVRLRLVLLLLLTLFIYLLSPDHSFGSFFTQESIEKNLAALGFWAPFGFILFYGVGVILTVPASLLTAVGGIIFGPFYGTALIMFGATFGASGAFYITRYIARESIERRFGRKGWFRKMDDGIREQGIYFILFLRLVPLFPFNVINYAAGLTNIRFRDYFFGTFIGIAPATFVFANAAYQLRNVAAGTGEIPDDFYLSLALLALLALLPLLYKKFKKG